MAPSPPKELWTSVASHDVYRMLHFDPTELGSLKYTTDGQEKLRQPAVYAGGSSFLGVGTASCP